jgi:transcriptional regulator with XRE-family HTH domain
MTRVRQGEQETDLANATDQRAVRRRFGASIRRTRLLSGLSLTALASRAGISKSTLSDLESGAGNPSLETLWAIATALGVPVGRLFDEASPPVRVIRARGLR